MVDEIASNNDATSPTPLRSPDVALHESPDAVGPILININHLPRSSPFKDLADVGKVRAALSDPGNETFDV